MIRRPGRPSPNVPIRQWVWALGHKRNVTLLNVERKLMTDQLSAVIKAKGESVYRRHWWPLVGRSCIDVSRQIPEKTRRYSEVANLMQDRLPTAVHLKIRSGRKHQTAKLVPKPQHGLQLICHQPSFYLLLSAGLAATYAAVAEPFRHGILLKLS